MGTPWCPSTGHKTRETKESCTVAKDTSRATKIFLSHPSGFAWNRNLLLWNSFLTRKLNRLNRFQEPLLGKEWFSAHLKDHKFVIHTLNWSKGWCLSCMWSLGGDSSHLFFIWQSLIKPFWFLWDRVAQRHPPRTHPQQVHASLPPLKRFQLLCLTALADLTSNEIWSVSEKNHRLPRLSIQRPRHRKPFQVRQLIRNIHRK